MAEILTIKQIDVECPINTRNGCVKIDSNIYINTPTQIYKYSIINKQFELLLNKGNTTNISVCTDGENLYMCRPLPDTSNGYLCKYNINTGVYNDTVASVNYGVKKTPHYTTKIIYKNNYVDISLVAQPSYPYHKVYRYYIDTNTISLLTDDPNDKARFGQETQFVDDYFFGWHTLSNPPTIEKYIGTNSGVTTNTIGTYSSMPNTLIKGVFKHNELHYIVYNTDIYTFNSVNSSFNKLDVSLPFSMGGSWVSGSNGDFYIFNYNKIINIKFVDYNISYNITNNDGSVVYVALEGQLPITNIRFNYTEGSTVGYSFNTLGDNISGQFDIIVPNNKKLIGFATSPNATRAIIPLNTDIESNIYTNTTFYAVFGTYKPPDTVFSIELYQNSAEPNRVDKGQFLVIVGTLLGALREYTSITDLSINVQMDIIPNFNYIYIPVFNRYYFVTDISSVRKNMWEISASCDVLMTYKDALYQCAAFIDRNEIDYNLMIVDNKTPIQQGQNITTHFVSNNLFSGAGTYVLQGLNLGAEENEDELV